MKCSFFTPGLMCLILCLSQINTMAADEETKTVAKPVPAAQVAHFHLSGQVTEAPISDPFGFSSGQVTTLKNLVGRLDRAAVDKKVKAVVLTYDRMGIGLAQMQELRAALERVRAAGKKLYVHAEAMNLFLYALLCEADHLSVAPESSIWITGLYGESLYLKGLLDKIGVQADFLQMGDYKSAAETLTRTGPTDAAEKNMNWLLDGLYGSLVDMIAESRDKSPQAVRKIVDNGPYNPDEALEHGLIDAIETRDAFLARIRDDIEGPIRINNRYGTQARKSINFNNPLAMFSVLMEMFQPPKEVEKKAVIAVIYVEGAIVPGHSQPSPFGQAQGAYSGDIRKALEVAAKDESVKAVVLRINSPGGSAEASEVIFNATRVVQQHKPLVVSMGNVAASGGYYVACAADAIYANESTITASIGVVGGKLVTKGMWDTIGARWVGYKRGANADLFNSLAPFTDKQRDTLQTYMQEVYDVFKGHVEKGRGYRLRKPLDDIAGGRVYTGKQALDLGLVDYLGGFKDALECAAEKAGIDDYQVRVIPRPTDFITMMMEQQAGKDHRPTDIAIGTSLPILQETPFLQTLLQLLRKTEPERANALYQALQRVELIRQENVITMMPFELVIR